ncbi:uncharacterized protein LOC110461159 [Mizuhopecten yessoensis]|uniref:uncharacterized protein LOC110461159 n=1 Tax=Mizuhopecten yessoensis TaxID=6573 RepID=UPI000B45EFA4|nr:uncharacterized protein LOC110461159 [Mizuhopecten yessoensis]
MLDSTDSEQMSVLLSKYLDHDYTGTQEDAYIRKKAHTLLEHLNNHPMISICFAGSMAEGIQVPGSDSDEMLIDEHVTVMYPDQCIPPDTVYKTILLIRKADCRPGYVHLQLEQIGQKYSVLCFPCKTWPNEANEWITRTRLYGWPHQGLINTIVHNGCHLVPVGDKCSGNTLLQWRISFAKAEISLVHSFSHIQLKVYCLLKLFLKQIKEQLRETIGDDDILCSYFLKTTLFHAIENSNQLFWQEKNLFYCFWFCFNILIAWVRAGVCPHYFIEANNLFERKVHGQHQRILLDVLNNYCQMKWKCLSVGNFIKPSIWEHLCNTSEQAFLMRPKTVQENVFRQDALVASLLQTNGPTMENSLRQAIHSLSTSHTELDDIFTHNFAMKCLRRLATEKAYPDQMVARDNKTRYKSLKKCKRWMSPSASMGTDLLYLATFHFLTGNFFKTLDMLQ